MSVTVPPNSAATLGAKAWARTSWPAAANKVVLMFEPLARSPPLAPPETAVWA